MMVSIQYQGDRSLSVETELGRKECNVKRLIAPIEKSDLDKEWHGVGIVLLYI
jgi:hypothetical protein